MNDHTGIIHKLQFRSSFNTRLKLLLMSESEHMLLVQLVQRQVYLKSWFFIAI